MVLPVTGRDITDVSDVQAYIGGELAARAAANITDDQVRELQTIQTQLEDAYAGDDDERAVRLNHEFHRAINVAADSPEAGAADVPDHPLCTGIGVSDRGLAGAVDEHHRRVVAALETRDEDRARAAMSEHLRPARIR